RRDRRPALRHLRDPVPRANDVQRRARARSPASGGVAHASRSNRGLIRSERTMPSSPLKSLPPRQLVLVGIIAVVAAGAIVANGLIGLSRNQQELVQWTNAQAGPTVTLGK